MNNRDLSRELITLSRQGGIPVRDRIRPPAKKEGDATKKQNKGLAKSQSLPSLTQMTRSTRSVRPMGQTGRSTRMGGGWSTSEAPSGLANVKLKVGHILERGVSLDYSEAPFHRTALWEATWKNHADIVRLLAAKGATVSAADYQGRTPLHEAAFYGHVGLVDILLDAGHPMDCEDNFGQTPLFRAVEGGRGDIVRRLVERGADANRLDHDNVTVHHIAAFNGLPTFSHELLCRGAVKNRFTLTERADRRQTSLRLGGSLVVGEQ